MPQKYEKTLDQKIKNLKSESMEKQREQIESENQKLIAYIKVTREEKQKKSFWNKLFYK